MNDAERKLIRWAAKIIDQHRNGGYPGDVDGAFLQESAVDCGVLVPMPVHKPCDEVSCVCAETGEFPMECYRLEAMVQLALTEAEGSSA